MKPPDSFPVEIHGSSVLSDEALDAIAACLLECVEWDEHNGQKITRPLCLIRFDAWTKYWIDAEYVEPKPCR